MDYLECLRLTHAALEPRTYCEIGCWYGPSLAVSRSPTIAIDPKPHIAFQIEAPTRIYKMTSDEFFEQYDITELFGEPIDFGFVDGMHLVEFALRDFINMERNAHPGGVIAIDDILPADMAYTGRKQGQGAWTGDVYRLLPILAEYRPDLRIDVYDVEIKGFCLVSNLDPDSRVLEEAMAEIEQAIEQGRWKFETLEQLRDALGPKPAEALAGDLAELARRRESAESAAAAE
ncbi:MAG: class I SAM-dependent methyltransferase [Parasphingopyxis sp.]|nr:class I SAM-dependent methyltransferase [Sphingomonadales bacterium]